MENTRNIKALPKQFYGKGEVKGYAFTQIAATFHSFIYEVEHGGYKHYEVFKRLKRVNPYTGIKYVRYPNSRAFGIWAWTCMNLKIAKERFWKLNPKKPILKPNLNLNNHEDIGKT